MKAADNRTRKRDVLMARRAAKRLEEAYGFIGAMPPQWTRFELPAATTEADVHPEVIRLLEALKVRPGVIWTGENAYRNESWAETVNRAITVEIPALFEERARCDLLG